jgi:hypothetical protein
VKQDERDKLVVLIDYWIKHNKEHGDEFKEWAEKARSLEEGAVQDALMAAFFKMSETNELLLDALDKLKE